MKELFAILVNWLTSSFFPVVNTVFITFLLEIVKQLAKELVTKAKEMLSKHRRQQKAGSTAGTAEPVSRNSPTESEKSNTLD